MRESDNQKKKIQIRFDQSYITHYFRESLNDELRAIALFFRYQWRIVLFISILLFCFVIWFKPIPPSKIKIATGPVGSSLDQTAIKIADHLTQNGIEVEFVRSKGALDSLEILRGRQADIALSMSGIAIPEDEGLVSLGSVGYQPFWYFSSLKDIKQQSLADVVANRKIYIGSDGSATQLTVKEYLSGLYPERVHGNNFVSDVDPKTAAKLLEAKKIDGMFLVAGVDSLNIRQLLSSKNAYPVNFADTKAIELNVKGVEHIQIPKGGFSLWRPLPNKDLNMVARTSVLLTHTTLHPAIQYLVLEAAKRIASSDQGVLNKQGMFPRFVDPNAPRSKFAERFYEKGLPSTWGHLPYWIATFVDTAGIQMLTIFAIFYPLLGFIPRHRKFIFDAHASGIYNEIFSLNKALELSTDLQEIERLIVKCNLLLEQVFCTWAPKGSKQEYALLLNAAYRLNDRAYRKSSEFSQSQWEW